MSSDPTISGLLGRSVELWIRNATLNPTSGSGGGTGDYRIHRVQSVDPTGTHNSTDYFEIGSGDKTGITTDPTDFRFVVEENLHNARLGMILAGVNPSTGSGYDGGDFLNQLNTGFLVWRDSNDSVFKELAFGNLRIAESQHRFVMNGACTVQWTLEGTSGSWYRNAGTFPHPLPGPLDTSAPGGIHGKDARIALETNTAADKVYRLQGFTIRMTYPIQTIREMGRRQQVGKLSDTPTLTADFDLQPGDEQPFDVFYPASTDGGVDKLDLSDPLTVSPLYVNVYDPDLAEGASVVWSARLQNMKPTTGMPSTARVRQLTTARVSLNNAGVAISGTSGIQVGNSEITT